MKISRFGYHGSPALWLALVTVWWALASGLVPSMAAEEPQWREPLALNIVDIAGQVPDEVLEGHFVSGTYGGGYSQFVSSEVEGEMLRITLDLSPRRSSSGTGWVTTFTLLGQPPVYDHLGSIAPESWVRLYDGPTELTEQITWITYIEPPLPAPDTDASHWDRYPQNMRTVTGKDLPMEAEGRRLPANAGGTVTLAGDYVRLRAVFTVKRENVTRVSLLGIQEAEFRAFIGDCSEGDMGAFAGLVRQMRQEYPGIRHQRIMLDIPAGANYILVKYPPTPFDIYSRADYDPNDPNSNLFRGMSGTVRLAPDEGMLSQNVNHSGPFPLRVAFQDADQSAGPFLSLLPPVDRLTPPEFFVLADTEYDQCFQDGGCSLALLERIYNDTSPISIVYLQVEPDPTRVQAITLRARDDPRLPVIGEAQATVDEQSSPFLYRLYLPLTIYTIQHPAGLFERVTGRMVGYIE